MNYNDKNSHQKIIRRQHMEKNIDYIVEKSFEKALGQDIESIVDRCFLKALVEDGEEVEDVYEE
jgi:hypothetical protein